MWFQARRWPGGGPRDEWAGLTKNDVKQRVWKSDNQQGPSLLQSLTDVPAAMLPSNPKTPEEMRQMQNDLKILYEHLNMGQDDMDECEQILATLFAKPAKFQWSQESIAFLLSGKLPLQQPVQETPRHLTTKGEVVVQGYFYIMRPSHEFLARAVDYPFYLVCAKRCDEVHDGVAMVRVQFWDLDGDFLACAKDSFDFEPFCSGTWSPSASTPPGLPYDLVLIDTFR